MAIDIDKIIEEAHQAWIDALDVVEDPIFVHDEEFRILRCNRAYKELAGLSFKQIIGRPYFEIFPKSHAPMPQCLQTLKQSQTKNEEEEIKVDNNIFRSRSYAINDKDGNYLYSIHILEDITERKRSDEILQDEMRFSETLIQSLPDIFYLLDSNGRLLQWNKKYEELTGFTPEELMGADALSFVHEEDRTYVTQKLQEVFETGSASTEARMVLTNGLRYYTLLANRVKTKFGMNAIGIGIDTTDRKEAEILLQHERELSERLIETAPVIILFLNPHGKIIRFNHYMEILSGYSLNELKGADWFDTLLLEDEREKTRAVFLNAIDDIQTQGNISTLLTKDGRQLLIEWYDKTLQDAQGQTIGLLSFGMDVTERIQAEKEFQNEALRRRLLMNSSRDGIAIINQNHQIVEANTRFTQMLRYTPEEVLTLHTWDYEATMSEAEIRVNFANILDANTTIETRHRRKDGTKYDVEVSISGTMVNDEPMIFAVSRDITDRKHAEESLRRSNRALQTLSAGNLALIRAQNENELLKTITNVIVKEGGYIRATVDYAQNDPQKSIVNMAWSGLDDTNDWIKKISWGDSEENQMPVSVAIRIGKTQLCRNIAHECEFKEWKDVALTNGYISSIALPLIGEGRTFGALHIYSSEVNAFDKEEVRLLEELSNDLAYGIITLRTRIEHEQQSRLLKKSMEQSIQVIASTVEARDPYTSGHQQRVAQLATAIALEMGLSEEKIEGIHFAAIIHDLGKIHIPAEILSKPGKLTEIEYMLIQTHPQAGYNIIKEVTFPWPIADIILQHHEKLNGSGYPQGLKGEHILLEAKIITVADVFEAMSSHRPYRPALGIELALEEIRRGRGSVYEASVVDACLKLFEEKGWLFSNDGNRVFS